MARSQNADDIKCWNTRGRKDAHLWMTGMQNDATALEDRTCLNKTLPYDPTTEFRVFSQRR